MRRTRLAAVVAAAAVMASLALRATAAAATASAKRAARKRPAPKPPPVSAKLKAQAAEAVAEALKAGVTIEGPAALIPFFELLYREQRGELDGPLRVLQFGDSHTAADEWTGAIRALLQGRFGDGGGGYSLAGSPFLGYRRMDLRGGESRGWRTEGLLQRDGDGFYGLGGVSIVTSLPRQAVYVEGECHKLEVFYLKQPGGGSLQLYDNDAALDTIETDGDIEPGYYTRTVAPGIHRFELRTLDRKPVRLFGWVTENDKGVTWETLGINGAQASVIFQWNEQMLKSNIARRNPALIVLAYGTNEASSPDWTRESYTEMFSALLMRLREAAPAASILVIGPPDRYYRVRGKWQPYTRVDRIVQAQRDAAIANHCAFWDLRERMGGEASMRAWVLAGLAQYDHVHFTAPGYRMLGEAAVKELLGQYAVFQKARESFTTEQISNGQTNPDR